jgi:hypothetical protein
MGNLIYLYVYKSLAIITKINQNEKIHCRWNNKYLVHANKCVEFPG